MSLLQLRLRLDGSFLDIEEVSRTQPDLVRECLIFALLLLPLDEHNLQRIQLGEAFRRSLQAPRKSTPYRLHSVISACKAGRIDETSLEARVFRDGGIRAVTGLAAAAADNNEVMPQLEALTDEELRLFLKSVKVIKWHSDLLFLAEAVDRKRPSITSKKTSLVRPRPSRSTKTIGTDNRRSHKSLRHVEGGVRQTEPNSTGCPNMVVHDGAHAPSSDQPLSYAGSSDAANQLSAERCLDGEETVVMTGLPGPEYYGGNYRIDLDDMVGATPSLDLVGSNIEYYGIDLDHLNAF
ncbi:hypothetical protein LTR67_011079 [Exophiala xenobiotica]